ncbi:MAG: EF-P lysine aminoacylase GenX [Planctomycetota bacterium]|nr:MAG: EF-P lysine aminoacylase GenX [Planctomycetota bacterium]
MPDSASDWKPSASWRKLRRRAELLRQLRAFFAERDFLEVETPLLSSETVVEAHIDPLAVTLPDDPRDGQRGRTGWLQASPEAAMKRLLVTAAEEAEEEGGDEEATPRNIYQIARAFRGGEAGRHHNLEFTLVEWYCIGQSYDDAMTLLSDLASKLLGMPAAERVTYREAFLAHAEIDPLTAETQELVALATASGVAAPPALGDDRDAWLDLLLTELVVPRFARERPTILCDYPATQAALARVEIDERHGHAVARRFELFAGGVELANGYWELLDADELRGRTATANALRKADGRMELPPPERLLAAMESGLPACCGCALGLDRVVMLATEATSIDEVIAFPHERA